MVGGSAAGGRCPRDTDSRLLGSATGRNAPETPPADRPHSGCRHPRDQRDVAGGQAAPHAIDKGPRVGPWEARAQAAQQLRAQRPRGSGDLLCQRVEEPGRQLLGVVEDLPLRFATRLGVSPDLGLPRHHLPAWRELQSTDWPCAGLDLHAHRHQRADVPVDLLDRQGLGAPEQCLLQPANALDTARRRVQRDALEQPRRAWRADGEGAAVGAHRSGGATLAERSVRCGIALRGQPLEQDIRRVADRGLRHQTAAEGLADRAGVSLPVAARAWGRRLSKWSAKAKWASARRTISACSLRCRCGGFKGRELIFRPEMTGCTDGGFGRPNPSRHSAVNRPEHAAARRSRSTPR